MQKVLEHRYATFLRAQQNKFIYRNEDPALCFVHMTAHIGTAQVLEHLLTTVLSHNSRMENTPQYADDLKLMIMISRMLALENAPTMEHIAHCLRGRMTMAHLESVRQWLLHAVDAVLDSTGFDLMQAKNALGKPNLAVHHYQSSHDGGGGGGGNSRGPRSDAMVMTSADASASAGGIVSPTPTMASASTASSSSLSSRGPTPESVGPMYSDLTPHFSNFATNAAVRSYAQGSAMDNFAHHPGGNYPFKRLREGEDREQGFHAKRQRPVSVTSSTNGTGSVSHDPGAEMQPADLLKMLWDMQSGSIVDLRALMGRMGAIVQYKPSNGRMVSTPVEVDVRIPVRFMSYNAKEENIVVQQWKRQKKVRTLSMGHPSLNINTPFSALVVILGKQSPNSRWVLVKNDGIELKIAKAHTLANENHPFSLRIFNFTPRDQGFKAGIARFKAIIPAITVNGEAGQTRTFIMMQHDDREFKFTTGT